MHAQEWITTSTACWVIQHVVDRVLHDDGPDAAPWRALAQAFEWHVFPNVNPDGYEYSFNTVRRRGRWCWVSPVVGSIVHVEAIFSFWQERAWRKTRSRGLVCYGVDGNRNWAYGWNRELPVEGRR